MANKINKKGEKIMKKIIAVIIIISVFILTISAFVGCDKDKLSDWSKYTAGEFGIKNSDNPLVEITFSTGDKVRLELYPNEAPITVENFIRLAKAGTYNGLTMHRIIANFMIQGGGFTRGNEMVLYSPDLPGVTNIKGEFSANGVANNVNHLKGVISMARATDMDSASSQFFICSVDYPSLDGLYAAFGRVIDEESMQAVVRISKVQTGTGYAYYEGYPLPVKTTDIPVDPINIVKVEVRE